MSGNAIEQSGKAPYFVMIDHEQTVSSHATLNEARLVGQLACDAEPIPCSFSIQDAAGNHVEDIARSDCKSLSEQVKTFMTSVPRC